MIETGATGTTMLQCPPRRGGTVPEWASWSIEEAAEETGYHPEYLRRLCRKEKVEAVRVGNAYLIRVSSLQTYIKALDPTDPRTGARRARDG